METTNNIKIVVDYCRHKQWSKRTIENYSCALKKFLFSFANVYQHDHISEADVSDYLLKIKGRSSRCTAHSVIKLWFMLKGKPNKLKFIPYPEKEDKLPIHVNKEEFLKMISVCSNKKHRAIICLLFDTGLRVSEVVNLQISQIDSSNMILNVVLSKGRKDRKVKFTKVLLSILRDYFIEYTPKKYLFEGQNKEQYSIKSCQEVVKQLTKKAGITKNFTPHKMRHGYAMTLLENGSTLEEIANQLGHSDTKTTQIYARMNNNVIQKIQSPLEQIISDASINNFLKGNQLKIDSKG